MLYGNSSMGYGYSPDRRKDVVNHYGYKSQFLAQTEVARVVTALQAIW